MLIEIPGPIFKCEADENIFLSRLYDIPNYDNVIGKGGNLYLTLTELPGKKALDELQVICDTWGTTFKVLGE